MFSAANSPVATQRSALQELRKHNNILAPLRVEGTAGRWREVYQWQQWPEPSSLLCGERDEAKCERRACKWIGMANALTVQLVNNTPKLWFAEPARVRQFLKIKIREVSLLLVEFFFFERIWMSQWWRIKTRLGEDMLIIWICLSHVSVRTCEPYHFRKKRPRLTVQPKTWLLTCQESLLTKLAVGGWETMLGSLFIQNIGYWRS